MPYLLFVDDDSNVLNINRNYFESRGFSVSVAQTADQALDHVKKYPVDCVVLDIMMPGMDGYEATRAIRLSEKVDAADIPIIALTANAFAEDAKAAHDAGMNAHLSKPLDFNKLKNILARIKKNGSVSL